ncbi:MAG: hypothetical protein ACJ8C4_05420 [Gemmataceae bacterium]
MINRLPQDVIFEESYVLEIRIEPYVLLLEMVFALASDHPDYVAPKENERLCLKKGRIRIQDFQRLVWTSFGIKPGSDLTGEIDYGNLDGIRCVEDTWHLEGDWGIIECKGQMSLEFGTAVTLRC